MSTYSGSIALARRLIAAKGTAIVITPAKGAAGFDPVTQKRTAGSAAEPFSAVAVGFPPGRGAEKEIGSLVDRKLIELYIATTDGVVQPEPGCTLGWGGHAWTIKWTATYDPAADGAIFTRAYAER